MQAWLRDYAENNDDLIISVGEWPTELFGVEGPRKEWIDEVIPNRLVVIFDSSGHSQWVNSALLNLLGIDKDTPDPSPGLSVFVRDPDGEPTGWVKEFALVQTAGELLLPSDEDLRANLRAVVDWFAERGITSLFDMGNLEFDDQVYQIISDFEAAGELSIRYEGSYHVCTNVNSRNIATRPEGGVSLENQSSERRLKIDVCIRKLSRRDEGTSYELSQNTRRSLHRRRPCVGLRQLQ